MKDEYTLSEKITGAAVVGFMDLGLSLPLVIAILSLPYLGSILGPSHPAASAAAWLSYALHAYLQFRMTRIHNNTDDESIGALCVLVPIAAMVILALFPSTHVVAKVYARHILIFIAGGLAYQVFKRR